MRERVTRAALRAFPRAIRSARGNEMLGTLLDASATSRTRFAHEIADLVRSGLRARASRTTQAGAMRLAADGFCLAAVWLLTLFLAADVGNRIRGPLPGDPAALVSSWSLALLGSALVLALIGSDRLAGVAALLFTASLFDDPARYNLTGAARLPLLVPLICFGALLLAPRRRKPRPPARVARRCRRLGARGEQIRRRDRGGSPPRADLLRAAGLREAPHRSAAGDWVRRGCRLLRVADGAGSRWPRYSGAGVSRRGAADSHDRDRAHPARNAGTHAAVAR